MITPGQARKALRDYPHLQAFLAAWFPAGRNIAVLSRYAAAGKPVERLVIARADVQSVLDGLTYAIHQLSPLDRRIVILHYLEQRDAWGVAQALGMSRRNVYRRLDVIHAEIAVRLSRMDIRFWWSFRRFAKAVLEDEDV